MSVITDIQARAYALAAGFTGSALDTIVAIAHAESSLNTQAVNSADPNGGSFGVLQINGVHFQSGATTKQCAFDPACSFKFAFGLSKSGTDFNPWGSYTDQRYLQYMPGGALSQQVTGLPTISTTNAGPTSPTSCAPWDIPCILTQLVHTDWFVRGSLITVGLLVAIIGIFVLFVGHGAKV